MVVPESLYRLAEGSKQLRQTRKEWVDRWDFNRFALHHLTDEQKALLREIEDEYYADRDFLVHTLKELQYEVKAEQVMTYVRTLD